MGPEDGTTVWHFRQADRPEELRQVSGAAVRVLELLARYTRPVPTLTIARECSIPKSSAHHLLNVMRVRNFVSYYETERAWGLGVAVFEVGSAYLRSEPLQHLGRPILNELTRQTEEASHLATLRGTDVLYIDKQAPVGPAPKLVTGIGVRLPAHLTAVGRAILSELSEAQVRALYANQQFVQRTSRGPTTIDELLTELEEVRQRGFAFEDQMVTPGIACIASVVFSHEGVPAAAVGMTYVSAQRTQQLIDEAADLVRRAALRLSRRLGYSSVDRVWGALD
jgi:DNA-binding IclR family transcriptional regulator